MLAKHGHKHTQHSKYTIILYTDSAETKLTKTAEIHGFRRAEASGFVLVQQQIFCKV